MSHFGATLLVICKEGNDRGRFRLFDAKKIYHEASFFAYRNCSMASRSYKDTASKRNAVSDPTVHGPHLGMFTDSPKVGCNYQK